MNQKNFIAVLGNHYDMGCQQGERFAIDNQNTFRRILRLEGMRLVKPGVVPDFLFGYFLRKEVAKRWQKNIEIITPRQFERMKGISSGSGTDLEELLVVQALEVMADDVSLVMTGCFSAVFLPQRIDSNEVVAIKNFDFISEFKIDNLLRFSQPKGKLSSLELTYKQIAGSHDGINEKGLCVTYNYGLTTEKIQSRLPMTLLVQEILENCQTSEDALGVIRNFRYPNAAILTLADKNNNAVSIEITPDHIGIRKPENGFLVNTNFFIIDEMKKYDIPSAACYSNRAPKGIRGLRIHETNEKRYHRAMDIIKAKHKLNLDDLKGILTDHGDGFGSENTICRHGEFFSTQVSAIFYPSRRKALVSFGHPCEAGFTEYVF